ncbi:hypothetical protein C4K35_4097 [Pseudomonas chlororaphis subsp. piscium]|uniref:hypothetical protein n=1 Tax=Pseudomonas chlororaphis TaxID=587753 RepID=UPI000F575951|nr:hypothetical protein [Pseudomonas chlororaphis]AZC51676.1 hypothetical protein C4K35_4097 [Pseudomonas chlororaphis subsp. piscium]
MNIDSYSVTGPDQTHPAGADKPLPLDQRIGLQGKGSNAGPDPEFDQFYDVFMSWISESTTLPQGSIQSYLKQYTNTGGELTYKTSQKQVNVLTQVMVRMKEQGLENSGAYKDVKLALVSVSASNMFVQEFMQDVFKPSDDEDDRENSSW